MTAFDGGALLSTTTAGVTDANFYQILGAGFKIGSTLATPKETFFKYSGILGDVVNSAFYAGLIATTATPLTAADGLYVYKATGATALTLVSKIGGVTTSYPFPAACAPVNGVQFEIGFHVDPLGNIEAFWNPTTGDNPVGYAQAAAGQPVGSVVKALQTGATSLVTSALLTPSFGIQNGAAAVKTLTTDFIVAERHR
jgi:hypothetical protein